ncbi:hypothetical protein BD410DRAFT_807620, partial [Rickenella mellea]
TSTPLSIVEEKTAIKSIEYLCNQRVGPAMFTLNTIPAQPSTIKYRSFVNVQALHGMCNAPFMWECNGGGHARIAGSGRRKKFNIGCFSVLFCKSAYWHVKQIENKMKKMSPGVQNIGGCVERQLKGGTRAFEQLQTTQECLNHLEMAINAGHTIADNNLLTFVWICEWCGETAWTGCLATVYAWADVMVQPVDSAWLLAVMG